MEASKWGIRWINYVYTNYQLLYLRTTKEISFCCWRISIKQFMAICYMFYKLHITIEHIRGKNSRPLENVEK